MAARGYTVASTFQGASKNRPLRNLLKTPVGGTLLWGASITGGKVVVTYQRATMPIPSASSTFTPSSMTTPVPQPSYAYCGACGSRAGSTSNFCSACGVPLSFSFPSPSFTPTVPRPIEPARQIGGKKRGGRSMVKMIVVGFIGIGVLSVATSALQSASPTTDQPTTTVLSRNASSPDPRERTHKQTHRSLTAKPGGDRTNDRHAVLLHPMLGDPESSFVAFAGPPRNADALSHRTSSWWGYCPPPASPDDQFDIHFDAAGHAMEILRLYCGQDSGVDAMKAEAVHYLPQDAAMIGLAPPDPTLPGTRWYYRSATLARRLPASSFTDCAKNVLPPGTVTFEKETPSPDAPAPAWDLMLGSCM